MVDDRLGRDELLADRPVSASIGFHLPPDIRASGFQEFVTYVGIAFFAVRS